MPRLNSSKLGPGEDAASDPAEFNGVLLGLVLRQIVQHIEDTPGLDQNGAGVNSLKEALRRLRPSSLVGKSL